MGRAGQHDRQAMRTRTVRSTGLRALGLATFALFLADCSSQRNVYRPKRKKKPKCKTCPSFGEARPSQEGLPLRPVNPHTDATLSLIHI